MSSLNQRLVNILTCVLVVIQLLHLESSANQLGVNLFDNDDPLEGHSGRLSLVPFSGSRSKRSEPATTTTTTTTTTTPTSTSTDTIEVTTTTSTTTTTTTHAPVPSGADEQPVPGTDRMLAWKAHSPATAFPWGQATHGTTSRMKMSTTTTTKVPLQRTTSTTKRSTTKTSTTTSRPMTSKTSSTKPIAVIETKPKLIKYDAKDVSLFLESHLAWDVHDPRAYMTNERLGSVGRYLRYDMDRMSPTMMFAFIVRMFHEMGRRLASQMNNFVREAVPLLDSTPDLFGIKPGKELYDKAFFKATNSKDDLDPANETQAKYEPNPISSRIGADKDKAKVFNASIFSISTKLAHVVLDVVNGLEEVKSINIKNKRIPALKLIADAMEDGALEFFRLVQSSDKFRIPSEVMNYLSSILRNIELVLMRHERDNDRSTGPIVEEGLINLRSAATRAGNRLTGGYSQMNSISDKQALVGPWNNYLFHDLGTSERVIKLFGSLLRRVPVYAKGRWINMYMEQVKSELEKTLPTFILMQGLGPTHESSENYLLKKANITSQWGPLTPATSGGSSSSSSTSNNDKQLKNNAPTAMPGRGGAAAPMGKPVTSIKPSMKTDSESDRRNRVPARCYLAGRRWRLILRRAMVGLNELDQVLMDILEKINLAKSRIVNELARLCLPRLEVGLRGWGINGDPHGDLGGSNDFPLKEAIDHLMDSEDPFRSGVQLGYKIGFKIGYNEKRNATLEMERSNGGAAAATKDLKKKADEEVNYLARASYRHGATMGARKAFEIAIHEGYLTTLKVSLRAGMLLPAQTASKMAALKGAEFGGQAGQEAGRALVNKFLVSKDFKEDVRTTLRKLGESNGLLAGTTMGELLGAQVGKEAAEEAFRRSILRGGRITKAKWNLDEFEAGARDGFEYGVKEGEKVASSAALDPSAPKHFQFAKPTFSNKDRHEQPIDHWEKDLITPLTAKALNQLHAQRNHTIIQGTLKGTYKTAKEVKKSLKRVSYKNVTYNLDIDARGYIVGDIAYLNLEGKVNNFNVLHGSLVAANIFGDQ